MNKKTREAVYSKYDGHCAYCGRPIEYKDMQVDHKIPQRKNSLPEIANQEENLLPSCRRCNHYKRGNNLETFRRYLLEMEDKVLGTYLGKVARDYGMVDWQGWNGRFYFEEAAAHDK